MTTEKRRPFGLKDLEKQYGKLTVGRALNGWRLAEEMSLKEFGKRVGLSVANLCDIEKGRKGVSPAKAAEISEALGVPPALLIRLSIEESLESAGLHYKVDLKPAA